MTYTFEDITCDHCGANLCVASAFDLEGNRFYCNAACGEAGERDWTEERKRRADYLARIKAGEIKPGTRVSP